MRFNFPPIRRSRHPLVRALSVLAGLAVVGVLMVFGVVVLGVLVVGGSVLMAVRHWKLSRQPQAARTQRPANVLEGEYVVLRNG
ncbi:hypothetical protein [Pinirhizobacter sp.]|jgi:hypothetical protein|uniref:hypothetical protein n=1 Tax=Pinirhizobacter sp. TaxID=2950432 RepID=UPI002F40B4F8